MNSLSHQMSLLLGFKRLSGLAIGLCMATFLAGCGEKFTKEGNALGVAINEHLIAQKLCLDTSDCQKQLEMYGGHGNRVNFSAYAVKNLKLVHAVTGFVASDGVRITKGVPISIAFYADAHENHVNTLNFSKPIIKLEVNK